MKFEMAEIKIEKFEIMDIITTSTDDDMDCDDITDWS